MELSRQLVRELKLNYGVIQAQLEGLTHEDTLLQLPFRGNCANWVLGHIVNSRGGMLKLLEVEPLWDESDYVPYKRESEPITGSEQALPLSKLLEDLVNAQEHLVARLKRISQDAFAVTPEGDDSTVGAQISFLSWHETYHTGQFEYLRQLAGKGDKVI